MTELVSTNLFATLSPHRRTKMKVIMIPPKVIENTKFSIESLYCMVPGAGIEPARPCEREILSLLCLPISPPGLIRSVF